jgi:hypothetical protein
MRGTIVRRSAWARDRSITGPNATRPGRYPTMRTLRIRCPSHQRLRFRRVAMRVSAGRRRSKQVTSQRRLSGSTRAKTHKSENSARFGHFQQWIEEGTNKIRESYQLVPFL